MKKYYSTAALVYGILAMCCGVFYREFTKFMGFTGETTLSVAHTHYFLMGMFFFLALLALDRDFPLADVKRIRGWLIAYQIGLNLTVIMLVTRGICQVIGLAMSRGLDASISGFAGIGHMFMGISAIWILVQIRKAACK